MIRKSGSYSLDRARTENGIEMCYAEPQKRVRQLVGAPGGYAYRAAVSVARPPTDYTAADQVDGHRVVFYPLRFEPMAGGPVCVAIG